MNKKKLLIGFIVIICILMLSIFVIGSYLTGLASVTKESSNSVKGEIYETQRINDSSVQNNQGQNNPSQFNGKVLELTSIDVDFDDDSEKNLEDGDIIHNVKPGDTLEFVIKIKNNLDKEIKDITIKVTIEKIDDGEDIKEESKSFDLEAGDEKKIKINLDIPEETEENDYDVVIKIERENKETSESYKEKTELSLKIQKIEEKQEEFTIIDDYGRTVVIPKYPQRIISLAPSTTEILYAVGLGDKIVGVDDYSDYPEEAKNKTKIGNCYPTPNLEIILSLKPDLIVTADITSKDFVTTMEEKGLKVIVLAPKTINGIIQNIRLVGLIGNKAAEANNLADNLEQRINAITSKTSNSNFPKVYVEYYPYWTFGPGSFSNDLILMAGGRNIAATTTTAYPNIDDEFIVSSNPEIIIYTIGPYTTTTIEEIKRRTGWYETDAVKNNKIYTLDDNIISRPGPRIVDALEQLAELIHPELFE